jgi:hypothetical protein
MATIHLKPKQNLRSQQKHKQRITRFLVIFREKHHEKKPSTAIAQFKCYGRFFCFDSVGIDFMHAGEIIRLIGPTMMPKVEM